ncbi:MAG: DUF1697 domain-containing protein, partial [Povalibacter sp.]
SSSAALAGKIESALEKHHGFSAPTVVISAAELNAIVESNPLVERAPDASRHLVAFVMSPDALMKARPLLRTDWTPDALAIGPAAAYLWCATGILDSKMLQAFARALTNTATTRNWATVMKLHALVNAEAVAKKG